MSELSPSFPSDKMIPANEVLAQFGRNFSNIQYTEGSTYADNSTVIIVPTRGKVHPKMVRALLNLMPFMNQKRHLEIIAGDEVGHAYTSTIATILANPELSKWKYVMTIEDDNIIPPDAHHRLVKTIEKFKFDAVSGIYFTKGEGGMPQAYGDPDRYRMTGELEFRPRDIREILARSLLERDANGQIVSRVVEVNGIAMGCALYRMELFREIAAPWFLTQQELTPTGPAVFTQDLYFCKKAKEKGKRFAVDLGIPVGHLDINTGEVW